MGLRDTLSQAVGAAFSAIGDIAETVAYTSNIGNPMYNTTTGDVTFDDSTTVSVSMVFTYFRRNEVDNLNVLATDIKAMCRQADLPVAPRVGDTLVRNGDTFRVEYFSADPAGATWKFKLRKG